MSFLGNSQSAAVDLDHQQSPSQIQTSGSPTFFAVPPLKKMLVAQFVNQLGSIESIEEFIAQHPATDLRSIFQPALIELRVKLACLLMQVAHGHYAKVKEFLETHREYDYLPCLLNSVGIATGSSGQRMKSTPLGMALSAEDDDYIDQEGRKTMDGIAQLIMQHLRRLADGEAVIAGQIAAQFPEGWQEQEQKNHDANLSALNTVRAAIAESKDDAACEAALKIFRNQINPQGVITTGKQWDARLMQVALDLGYNEYDNFDARQNHLYYVKVVGYIQRTAPDNYAQAQAQGAYYIVNSGEKLNRSLDFKFGGGSYFPLTPGESGLGHDYWAGAGCRRDGEGWLWARGRAGDGSSENSFRNLVQAKTASLHELLRSSPSCSKHLGPG